MATEMWVWETVLQVGKESPGGFDDLFKLKWLASVKAASKTQSQSSHSLTILNKIEKVSLLSVTAFPFKKIVAHEL